VESVEFIAQVVATITQPPEGGGLARAGPTGSSKMHRANAPMKRRRAQRGQWPRNRSFASFCLLLIACHIPETRNKKALRETQTLRAGYSKAEPNISPAAAPFPGARDGQNLISFRWSLPLPTNPVW